MEKARLHVRKRASLVCFGTEEGTEVCKLLTTKLEGEDMWVSEEVVPSRS